MARPEKVAEVELLVDKMKRSNSLVIASYTGLSVERLTAFRVKCRAKGIEFRVVKNRLARRAATELSFASLDELLKGPTGIAFGVRSPVDPAKLAIDFARDNEHFVIKGGYLDGKVLTRAEVEALSKVPSREELLAMIMRGFQAPLTGFVGVLSGTLRKLMGTLEAVAKQKAEAAP
jgi:large subunit ribosomal protein L10